VGYDNFGTYYLTAEGLFDDSKNSMTLEGEERDSSQRVRKYDIVFHFTSPTRYVSEVIFKGDTPASLHTSFKVAEVNYTQSK
jgi:hypothetical protein